MLEPQKEGRAHVVWGSTLETLSTFEGASMSVLTRWASGGRAVLHWWHSSRLNQRKTHSQSCSMNTCCQSSLVQATAFLPTLRWWGDPQGHRY